MAVSVQHPKRSRVDGKEVVSASIGVDGQEFEVWYRASQGPLQCGVEPFVAAALVPAMKAGGPLQVEGEVSPRLLAGMEHIQEVLAMWYPELRPIPIVAKPKAAVTRTSPGGVASFFSGGVDSFYTLLRHLGEIDQIIFVQGFDIPWRNAALGGKVAQSLRQAAAELRKPFLEVETNLRDFVDRYAFWGTRAHGAALASVGLLLSPQIRSVLIPASHTYRDLLPWGSHPLLDHLWSTEDTAFIHDGAGATRVRKVAEIARNGTALRWLRVCCENPDGAYNCGRCEKCLRTMLELRMAGALERCQAFECELDLEAVAQVRVTNASTLAFLEENLQAVEAAGNDPALARALRQCRRRAQLPAPAGAPKGLWKGVEKLRRILALPPRGGDGLVPADWALGNDVRGRGRPRP